MESKSIITKDELEIKDFCISTREVAEMMGRDHKSVLRMLEGDAKHKGIIPTLSNQRQMVPVEFFRESSYIDAKGEKRKCYMCTKKGCDMLAHKMTGEKGILFTAKYINRFYDMETKLKFYKEKELIEANKRLEENIEKAQSLWRFPHKTKLQFNKLIKSLTANKDEEDAVKAWVLGSLNCTQWQDVPVNKYSEVISLIKTSASLISTKTFEQLKLF